LTTETKYGATVTNVKRKRVPGKWEQLQQNYENQSMYGHVGQPTKYSLMNEVYEMERIVTCMHVYLIVAKWAK